MVKNKNLIYILILLSLSFTIKAGEGRIRFIYCSDLHYGLEREFRGEIRTSAEVNRAMLDAFKLVETTTLPDDGGVCASEIFGTPDFVICTGDIANRMENGVQTAEKSWAQFENDWYSTLSAPLYLVTGNHDISNAIGYPKALNPETDATSAVQIFNRGMNPDTLRTARTFNHQRDKVHYSFTMKGIRFAFIGVWPDREARSRLKNEFATDTTATLIFTHDPPNADTKHFTNPNGKSDINSTDKFQNVITDISSVDNVKDDAIGNWSELEDFFAQNSAIKAYFHGDKNYNEFYDWHGTQGKISLPVFRVDSPMKGEYSAYDERLLSFIVVTIDPAKRLLTARECLWNTSDSNKIVWGASRTIKL